MKRLAPALFLSLAALLPTVWVSGPASVKAQAVVAAPAKANETFVKNLSDKAFGVLRDKSLKSADQQTQFRNLLREGFALDVIGNAVLGRHRTTATPAQLLAFKAAFPDYVIRIYASRLTDYSDTVLSVTGSSPVGTRGDVSVKTSVAGKSVSQPVKADWRVREIVGQGPKIIDLSLEGVSMVATQRDEFDARIQAKGLDALINDIKSNNAGVDVKKAVKK
jgi:phospholipid transport system substrate-binding protein